MHPLACVSVSPVTWLKYVPRRDYQLRHVTFYRVDLTAANESTDSTNVSSPLMCSEGFVYIEEVHQCRPHCPSWEEHEYGLSITYNVIFGTTAAVSVLASIVVLLLSCVRYKRM